MENREHDCLAFAKGVTGNFGGYGSGLFANVSSRLLSERLAEFTDISRSTEIQHWSYNFASWVERNTGILYGLVKEKIAENRDEYLAKLAPYLNEPPTSNDGEDKCEELAWGFLIDWGMITADQKAEFIENIRAWDSLEIQDTFSLNSHPFWH